MRKKCKCMWNLPVYLIMPTVQHCVELNDRVVCCTMLVCDVQVLALMKEKAAEAERQRQQMLEEQKGLECSDVCGKGHCNTLPVQERPLTLMECWLMVFLCSVVVQKQREAEQQRQQEAARREKAELRRRRKEEHERKLLEKSAAEDRTG